MTTIKTKINQFHQKVIKKDRQQTDKKKLRDLERLCEKIKDKGLEILPEK
mgnify:CR=1 FL=1